MKSGVRLLVATVLALFVLQGSPTGWRALPATARQRSAVSTAEPQSEAQPSTATARGKLIEGRAGYNYLCFLPKGYGERPTFWPLIVFLHGASSDENLEKLKRFGPIEYALGHDDFPFIVVAPASSRGWSVNLLDTLLERVQARFRVDRNRVYLTGLSMGGHATWKMAAAYPNRFAGIAPVAGAGNPLLAPTRLRNLPAWIFHGEKDEVVPVECGRMMIQALQRAGGEVKYTIYPDLGHDVWQPAYDNPELYRWFLQHRRNVLQRSR